MTRNIIILPINNWNSKDAQLKLRTKLQQYKILVLINIKEWFAISGVVTLF